MKQFGLHSDGRMVGPIDPKRVNDDGWQWFDTAQERDVAAFTKSKARDAKLSEIRTLAQQALDRGAPYNGARFEVSVERREEVIANSAAVANGMGFPHDEDKLAVRDLTRTKHELTETEYLDWAVALRDYVADVKETAEDHIDAVLALYADPEKSAEDINVYDTSGGWPE